MKLGQLRRSFERVVYPARIPPSDPDSYAFRSFLANLTGDNSWVSVWRGESTGEYKTRGLVDDEEIIADTNKE